MQGENPPAERLAPSPKATRLSFPALELKVSFFVSFKNFNLKEYTWYSEFVLQSEQQKSKLKL